MVKKRSPASFVEELAEFLASQPTRDELLNFHPSPRAQERAEELLQKQNEGQSSPDEREELEELAYAERLMRLVKARLRGKKVLKS
jgi:hypothetical protein